jgi:hypothetical protein
MYPAESEPEEPPPASSPPLAPISPSVEKRPKRIVDDSATESRDVLGRCAVCTKDSSSTPTNKKTLEVRQISRTDKLVKLSFRPEVETRNLGAHKPIVVFSAESATINPDFGSKLGADAPEKLKGKTCVVISTQGSYQPLYHEFTDEKDIPRIHLFYFRAYSQSPFDIPPTNVPKYFLEKQQMRDKKRHKYLEECDTTVGYCEICKVKVKSPVEHRRSDRHQRRVGRLDWSELERLRVSVLTPSDQL